VSEGAQKKPEKARKFQAIRGTRDLLPPDTALWNHVEQTAREVFGTFGYGEIRPPIFEATELFARSIGEETDVVSKEMYSFEDFELSELYELRTAILTWQRPLGGSEVFERVIALAARFAVAGAEAFNQGLIPKIPENQRALEDISYLREFLQTVYLQGDRESLPNIAQIKERVRQLRFGDLLTLRPEATASVCRAYIEHNMQQWPQPVKLYYIGPMFRRERPQKGRYRQFYQIGAEVLEAVRPDAAKDAAKELAKDAAVDAEVIEMLMTFFDRIGLQGTELSVNSIGHAADNCRRGYVAKLREELLKVESQLGGDSQRRIETNPLRVLDSKLEHEQAIIAELPHIADHLCDECKTHYAEVRRQLDLRSVKYKENWRLVRGLDYYMRTTFEITARGLGSQDAVCGGGRYDGLVELLGGPPTKGIGFAIGEDRVILSLQEQKAQAAVASHEPLSIYIAWLGERAYATALRAAKTLRAAAFRVDMPASELKFGKALERASKLNARFALILGENEVQSGEWTLKNLADGSQQKLTEAALLEYLRR
jgi:histidyl-tRNA synthetase